MGKNDVANRSVGARPDRHDYAFALAAIGTFALLLALGAGMTFFSDEWAFIITRSLGDPVSWLPPHNEHWSTVPVVLYRLLVETVGLRTYVPYLAVLAALHILVASLVYTHVRRASGRWPALAVGVIVLLLGSGFENLFWAFQYGFVISVAAGLGAMLAFEEPLSRRKVAAGTALVLLSLASSGMGLVFAAVVAIELALDPRRRILLAALNVPAAAYAVWYLTFGRFGLTSQRDPLTLTAMRDVPGFVIAGLADAGGAVAGVGSTLGLIVIAGLGLVAVQRWRSGAVPPRFVACALGIVVMYALIGSVRGHLFQGSDLYTRYTYVAGLLLFVGASSLVGQVVLPAYGTARTVALAGAGSLLAVSLVWNLQLMLAGKSLFLERAAWMRALLIGSTEPTRPPFVDPQSLVASAIRAYGSPMTDVVVPWAVKSPPATLIEEARRELASGETSAPIPH